MSLQYNLSIFVKKNCTYLVKKKKNYTSVILLPHVVVENEATWFLKYSIETEGYDDEYLLCIVNLMVIILRLMSF